MKVTTKGQVTIPLEIREKTEIVPTKVTTFAEKNDSHAIRGIAESERRREIIRNMIGKGDIEISTDEILALTRGDR